MVQLVGTVDLGDGFRVSAPGFHGEAELVKADVGVVGPDGRVPAGCLRFAALEAALVARSIRVRTVEVTPRELRRLPGPLAGPAADPFIQLEVTPPPGQGAVLLVQDELGALSWHAPRVVGDATARRGSGGAAGTGLVFQVPVPSTTVLMGSGGWLTKVLKVAFFDLATVSIGRVGRYLVRRWEDEHRPTRLRWFAPDRYGKPCVESDLITRQELAALSGRDILLFVHGTFATSHGAFGGLSRVYVERLWRRYGGRVLAFDHATMVDSPQGNVDRLLRLLPEGFTATFDIACQGRGALVARVLAGELGEVPAGISVRDVTFPDTPPAADPLPDADALTALVGSMCNALAALPSDRPGGLLGDVLTGLVNAAMVVASGAQPGSVPAPVGRFMRDLNAPAGAPAFLGIPTTLAVADPGVLALLRSSIADGPLADGRADWVFGHVPEELVVPHLTVVGGAGGAAVEEKVLA